MICRYIYLCQNRSCRKEGSPDILAIFKANPLPGVQVMGVGCLGQCGNGPVVLILPDEIWYHRVQPDDVKRIIENLLTAV